MMSIVVRRALWRAANDPDFRRRTLLNLGMALAEDGFILTNEEMAVMRDWWEPLCGLSERAAYERLAALARSHPR